MSGIVEVATTCNLSCEYCFAKRPSASIMTKETAEIIIKALLRYNGQGAETKFIWHGGEPLLAGIPFYKNVLDVQNRMASEGFQYRNSIQTNGTLLNDEWIDFLRDNAFGVGSSIDGLRELHDAKRRSKSNECTYDKVVENLMRAKERGLTIGVICVISRETLPYVEEIYRNMKSLGLPFTMSPVTPNRGQATDLQSLTPAEYTDVLIRLFDVWFDDPQPTITVNPPHSILLGIIYGGMPFYCSADDSCFSKFVSFLPDGSVYPCNRFAGEQGFRLGNINDDAFDALLNKGPRKDLMARTKENLTPCSTCESNSMCRGGCAHHAFSFYGDIMKPDYYCKAFFKAFSYYNERLNTMLSKAEFTEKERVS
ncbi:MAG: radical SAM protein [Nitrospirae bacterium]|nr:radical SAM protein [Nitrospirota bacterium]